MRLPILVAAATALSTPVLVAQGATYELGRTGCSTACATQNDPAPGFTQRSLTNEYAHAVQLGSATMVGAFSVYTESVSGAPATVQTALYLENPLSPGQPDPLPAAVGTLTVDGPLGWYSSTMNPPVAVSAGQLFFIGVDTNAIRPPDVGSGGATPPAPSFWRRPPFGGTAWAQTGIIVSPLWRIHCVEVGGGIATLTNATLPSLGGQLDLDLHGSAPGLPAFMALGFSTTQWGPMTLPASLRLIGAPACDLLVALDITTTVLPNPAGGPPRFSLPIPNDPNLAGVTFHNQGIVLNPGANFGGVLSTNLGTGVIQ